MKAENDKVYCPLVKREIDCGYCWELCNIANDDILMYGDSIGDWERAQDTCKECGMFEDDRA